MAVQCPNCGASNLEDQRFCGKCGAALDPSIEIMKSLLDVLLPSKIQQIIREQYKDQKILELETTQSIVTRLSDWSKLFAFVVGIPIALVLVLLGFLGFRTYTDFSKQIIETQAEAIASLRKDAQATANK